MTNLSKNKLLSPIDIITLAFCGWILLYAAVGINRVNEPLFHLPIYFSLGVLVLSMAWLQRKLSPVKNPRLYKTLTFVRALYPTQLFGYFFTSSYAVNQILFKDWLDPFFMRIDLMIFGYYPSLDWGQMYDGFWLSELFHGAYFAYYPMILGLPIYLYLKQPKAFQDLIFRLTFVFYMCYFIYSLLPVIGGRYLPEAMELTKVYRAGPFTHIMAFIYTHSGHLGGAFPSSHVGITLVLTMAALKYVRKLGYLFVVISFFLTLATVYCHYHWFIDAVFGVFAGIGGYYLAGWAHEKIKEQTEYV